MDVKRIEGVAVPTALAAVAAGTAGYIIPKAIDKNGEATFNVLAHNSITRHNKDAKLMHEADKLDRFIKQTEPAIIDIVAIQPTDREIKTVMAVEGGKYGDVAERLFNERYEAAKKDISKSQKPITEEETQKFLEKFARKHAKELEIKPEKGQTLTDAVKEYLKGKTAKDLKEAFLPSSVRRLMLNADYYEELENLFERSYDKAKKQFKPDEESQAVAKMFNAAKHNMKLRIAGVWGATAGAIALASTIIADRISHR